MEPTKEQLGLAKIAEAETNLKDFLDKYPHMQKYQKRIDEQLAKVPEEQRAEVCFLLLSKSYQEILAQISSLGKK